MTAVRPSAHRFHELVAAVLAGGAMPVCPVFAHRHHPVADQDAELFAEATLAFQSRFTLDLVKMTPASTWQIRDYGVEDADDPADALGRRRILSPVVRHPDDWRRLPRLRPGNGFTDRILRATRQVRRALPGVPVLATVYSPSSQAVKLAGARVLADHWRQAPEAVTDGLRTICGNTLCLIEALCDTGVDGVFLAVQPARPDVFTIAAYRGIGLGADRACLEAAASLPFTMLHLHGDGVYHSLFSDRPPAVVHLEAAPRNPTPCELLRAGVAVASGPAPGGVMAAGNAAAVAAEAETLLNRLKGPRFLLAPGCTLPLATPDANIDALVGAARTPRLDRPEERLPPSASSGIVFRGVV